MRSNKKPCNLIIASSICRYLPPIIAQTVRDIIYPRYLAYQHNYRFLSRAQTGSLFEGTTSDRHAYPFSVHGYFNWRNWAIALALCEEGDTIIEVGGNIGTETVGFADIVGPGGKVYVFEPLPDNIKALETLIRKNRFRHVRIIPKALGENDGKFRFVLPIDKHESGVGYVILNSYDNYDLRTIEIECMTLDNFRAKNLRTKNDRETEKIGCIFIDAEGFEVSILKGASRLICETRPPFVLEASPKLLRRSGFSN